MNDINLNLAPENKMSIKTVIGRVLVGFFIAVALFFVFGIGLLFWESHRIAREPVYCATLRNVAFADKYLNENLSETVKVLEIRDFRCFVFSGHPIRPVYKIILIGEANDKIDRLPAGRKHALADRTMSGIFRALEISGANPAADDQLKEIELHGGVYVYGNRLVIQKIVGNRVILTEDEEKRAFLEQFIRGEK